MGYFARFSSSTRRKILSKTAPITIVIISSVLALGILESGIVFGANNPSVSVKYYDQCSNDDGDGYATGDTGCRWLNGNLQANNSTYHEGESTVQRVLLEDVTNGQHTITFQYDTTKSGKHAYDFLTDDDFSELAPNPLTDADICDGASSSKLPDCSSLSPSLSPLIPVDPNANGFDSAHANRHFKIRNGIITNVSTPAVASGSYAGDSDTAVTVTFSVNTSTCEDGYNAGTNQNPVDACAVLISFGAHISSQADWGMGSSAVNISGSPYHVALSDIDGAAIGQRDNQMQASAIVVTPTVTTELHKADDTVVAVGGSVPLGTTMHDKVTVSGSTPTGTVSLKFFGNGTCTGTPLATSSNTSLSGGSVDVTGFAQGPLAAGTYSFLAHYNGDQHNTAADASCEYFTVNKADTTTVTHVHNTAHADVTNTSVPLGSVVHDNATVGTQVGSFAIGGNVTYTFYTSGDCTTGGDAGETVAVGNESGVTSALAAGNYSYKAVYAGDPNYNGFTGDCEPFSVSKADLSLATELHQDDETAVTVGGSVPLGTTMHDRAMASGLVDGFVPANNVTFTFFTNGVCDKDGAAAGSVALVSGVAHPSDSEGPLVAGDYSFQANLAGDDNYNGATSDCEHFTVGKANTTTVTEIHKDGGHVATTSVSLGDAVHDKAIVGTQVGSITIGGNVTYTFFTSGDCTTGAGTPETVGVGSESSSSGALAAGNYSYQAVYLGDSNYNGSTGDCEPLTVNKAQLGLVTTIHNGQHNPITTSQPLGTIVHDSAAVSGDVSGYAVPDVSFAFFENGTCDGEGTAAGSAVVTGGVADGSDPTSALGAGHYSYLATIPGNANYTGTTADCEPLTIEQADSTTTTQVRDPSGNDITNQHVPLGIVVHDTATVTPTGGSFSPTGTISYTFYTSGDCTTGAGTPETVALGDPSSTTGPLGAGSYSYLASYSGDDNFKPSTGECEPFTVDQATPDVSTEIHDAAEAVVTAVDAGATVHDKALVMGNQGFEPSGTVDFTFFTNGTCDGDGAASGTGVALVAGVAHPSDSQGPLAGGSYSFLAHYNGDSNYVAADAACEPLDVNKVTPGLSTTPNPTSGTIGTVLNDTANLTNGFDPTGSITFKLYSPSDATCSGTPAFTNTVSVNGNGSYPTSAGFASDAAGTWRWVASYSGNASNNAVTGGCDDEQVTIAAPVTRTLGFWQTHYVFTTSVFNANSGSSLWAVCSTRTVSNTGVLFGGFYASIPKKSDNKTKRTDLDQARMQLMQQLLAAILNHLAFGSGSTGMLTAAENAYCGTDKNAILAAASQLDAFNNSGDSQPTSQNTGNADPKASKSTANIAAWDILP